MAKNEHVALLGRGAAAWNAWRAEHGEVPDLFRGVLRGLDLSGFDLSRADLRGADLRGTKCTNTDLSGARLDGANLHLVPAAGSPGCVPPTSPGASGASTACAASSFARNARTAACTQRSRA